MVLQHVTLLTAGESLGEGRRPISCRGEAVESERTEDKRFL